MKSIAWLAFASVLVGGCSVELSGNEGADVAANSCDSTSDCRSGTCRAGFCVARTGELEGVLLEVVPPTGAVGVGGARYLQNVTGISENTTSADLALRPLSRLAGYLRLRTPVDPDQETCLSEGGDTVPVRVTLTPRGNVLGLAAVKYEVASTLDTACTSSSAESPGRVHQFSVDVPAGDYDIYVEGASDDPSCAIVPQLIRSTSVPANASVCLPVKAAVPERRDLCIPWTAEAFEQSLDGWLVDVVHPLTGQSLSRPSELHDSERVDTDACRGYSTSLAFSTVSGDAYAEANGYLVRLSPPENQVGPVIQLVGPFLAESSEGAWLFPDLGGPFPPPLTVKAWVSQEPPADRPGNIVPVVASVTLTATDLNGIGDGVFASYTTKAQVSETGRLEATVMPGIYRMRIVPATGSSLATTEEENVDLQCERLENPDRCDAEQPESKEGRTYIVPPAARITGSVTSPVGSGPLGGANIQLLPGERTLRGCAVQEESQLCSNALVDVLDRSLGEESFVPRATSTTADGRGRFTIDEADCGACQPNQGATFDVVVRPQSGSGMPWLVRRHVQVDGDIDIGHWEVPLPTVWGGTIRLERSSTDSTTVGGALIRAYVYFDDLGAHVANPIGIPVCADRAPRIQSDERCLRSLVQIAETRATDDGDFRLLLPSTLSEPLP